VALEASGKQNEETVRERAELAEKVATFTRALFFMGLRRHYVSLHCSGCYSTHSSFSTP